VQACTLEVLIGNLRVLLKREVRGGSAGRSRWGRDQTLSGKDIVPVCVRARVV
jgi:hypothetical protein